MESLGVNVSRKWSGTDELTVTGQHREVSLRSLSCSCTCRMVKSHVWQLGLAPDVQRLGSTLKSSIPEAWQRLWAIIALLVSLWDTEDDLLALTKLFLFSSASFRHCWVFWGYLSNASHENIGNALIRLKHNTAERRRCFLLARFMGNKKSPH